MLIVVVTTFCKKTKRLKALLTNIKLGWKSLPGTNTLAYCKNPQITILKSLTGLAPGWKDLLVKNNLAYLTSSSVKEKEVL